MAAAGLGAPMPARAGEGSPPIVGGAPAALCQWPSAVLLFDEGLLCTGTLVHPRIVLYAAHCGVDFTRVEFGERLGTGYVADVTECRRATTADRVGPMDHAYCELARPVDGVPIAPVLFGCEADILIPGREVTIVGFGENESEQAGVKRAAVTTFDGTDGGMLVIGSDGVSPSYGDSGGPAFVRLDDGTWRAFGIVSGGNGPGMPSYYVDMRNAAAWVESQSGHDLTPCHSATGTWQPGYECGGFAIDPTAGGSWDEQCGGPDAVSGRSSTCGPPLDADREPPRVAIRSPEDGAEIDEVPAEVSIEVDASDDLSGVRRVWLEIDGQLQEEDLSEPWSFTGRFEEGSYVLVAVAEDGGGNSTRSDEHALQVGESGCLGCGAGRGGGGAGLLVAFIALLWRRRGTGKLRKRLL